MPEFAGDVTLCRSGSQGKTIARLHPVVSEFLAADLWHTRFHLCQLKRAVFVGYMGLFFGCLFLLELAFGLVHSAN
jgi:hypothetical protein